MRLYQFPFPDAFLFEAWALLSCTSGRTKFWLEDSGIECWELNNEDCIVVDDEQRLQQAG